MGHTVVSHTLGPGQDQGKVKALLKMGDLSVGYYKLKTTLVSSLWDTSSIYYLDVSSQTNSFFFPV